MMATKRKARALVIATVAASGVLGLSSHAMAANVDWTWTGGASAGAATTGPWDNAAYWLSSSNNIPADSKTTVLTFGGSGSAPYTSTDDLNAGGFRSVGTITLNSTATVQETITGNGIGENGGGVGMLIQQNNSGSFAINNEIRLDNDALTLTGNGTGVVTLGGLLQNHNLDLGAGHRLSIVKNGTSTFVMTAANTYTGTTSVTAGKLRVDGTLSSGTLGITVGTGVANSGQLAGTSSNIARAISIANGGAVSPGDFQSANNANDGIGKLSTTGNFALVTGAKMQVEISGNAGTIGTAGTNFDQIALSGTGVTFTPGDATLVVVPLPGVVLNQAYPIVKATSPASVASSSFFHNLTDNVVYDQGGGIKYKVHYVSGAGGEIDLTFTEVPEPGSGTLILISASALLARRRRKHGKNGAILCS